MTKEQSRRITGVYVISQLVWIACVVLIALLCDGWKGRFLCIVLCLAMSVAVVLLVFAVVTERELRGNKDDYSQE